MQRSAIAANILFLPALIMTTQQSTNVSLHQHGRNEKSSIQPLSLSRRGKEKKPSSDLQSTASSRQRQGEASVSGGQQQRRASQAAQNTKS